MKIFYISTPITSDARKTTEAAKRACGYFRLSAIALSPILTFDYLDQGDWLYKSNAMDLMTLCTDVCIFTDEVSELMIEEIRNAQKLGLPIHFFDADRNKINFDALIINQRIGPGYRKMIAEANGETCCSGTCPYGSECCTRFEAADKPEEKAEMPPVEETVPEPVKAETPSILARLFGKAR